MARVDKVVYIHGVVGERGRTRKHTSDYKALRDGISNELIRLGENPLPSINRSVKVEWGWNTPDAADTRTLSRAQDRIAARVDDATPRDRTGFTSLVFAPAIQPVRELLMLGWSDILYYAGKGGKERIRRLVWNNILGAVGTDNDVDLTIISHSGGTLIAHDLLFWLFSGERADEIEATDWINTAQFNAARDKWRIRRFVTFGSPISALMVRSAGVADLMAQPGNARLDGALMGLNRPSHLGEDPIWLNVWDRHDVLSFPVAPFYKNVNAFDLYPDHSDSLLGSHNAYWGAGSVHRVLAENWA